MSLECPKGHGRQPVVHNITKDGAPAKRASDVLAKRLKCGCVVGGPEYDAFLSEVTKIESEEKTAIQAARKSAQDKKSKAYLKVASQGGAEDDQ